MRLRKGLSLLYLKQNPLLIALVIDESEKMLACSYLTAHFMRRFGLAKVVLVNMPVEAGVGTGIRCAKYEMLPFAAESTRQIEHGVVFGIDDLDLFALLRVAAGLEGRERLVIDVVFAVIIFL